MQPGTAVIVLMLLCICNCSPVPSRLGQVIEVAGGISEFVNNIRSAFGKSGEFAMQNGFDYSNVYNSLLQYSVMNAYQERQNHDLLRTQLEETTFLREDISTFNSTQLIISSIFRALLTILGIVSVILQIIQACRRTPRDQEYNN